MGSKHLNDNQKNPNDEFYTKYDHVKFIFDNYLKDVDFTDKVIYCFCDSEESNFVKYIKANKDRLKYSEFLYTSDDYNNHKDLFGKADYIICNPPFSKICRDIYPLIKDRKFFLFGSLSNLIIYYYYFNEDKDMKYINHKEKIETDFDNSDKYVSIVYLTNIQEVKSLHESRQYANMFDNLKSEGKEAYYEYVKYRDILRIEHVLNINKLKEIPIDYEGYMMVPTSILIDSNNKNLNCDIIPFAVRGYTSKKEGYTEDGVNHFKRTLIYNYGDKEQKRS